MNEEVMKRAEVLFLDHADKLDKESAGTDEYARTAKFTTDMFEKLIEAERIKLDHEAKYRAYQLDDLKRLDERDLKQTELLNAKAHDEGENWKAKLEFAARLGVAALSIGAMFLVAKGEASGWFIKSNVIKPLKF